MLDAHSAPLPNPPTVGCNRLLGPLVPIDRFSGTFNHEGVQALPGILPAPSLLPPEPPPARPRAQRASLDLRTKRSSRQLDVAGRTAR